MKITFINTFFLNRVWQNQRKLLWFSWSKNFKMKKEGKFSGKKTIKTVTTTTTTKAKTIKKRKTPKKKKLTKSQMDEALVENFVNLQKVLTNLTIKFDILSSNMAHLLTLFEASAKSFIEKYSGAENTEEEDMLKKLDTLLEQNKTIAKGLTLLEDKVRHKLEDEKKEERRLHGVISHETEDRPRPFPRI